MWRTWEKSDQIWPNFPLIKTAKNCFELSDTPKANLHQTGKFKISPCVDFLCIRKRRGKCGWIQYKWRYFCNPTLNVHQSVKLKYFRNLQPIANNSLLQCAFSTYLGSILATDLPKLQLQTENSLKSLLGKKCFFLPPKQYAHPKQMFSHMIAHQNCQCPFQSETILCRVPLWNKWPSSQASGLEHWTNMIPFR